MADMCQEKIGFATMVRTRRSELRLSQTELANLLGLDRGTISSYERGLTVPRTAQQKYRLAEVLGLSPDQLYTNTLGAMAVKPAPQISLGLNYGQLRRSFKETGGLQLRAWKKVFRYLLLIGTLPEAERSEVQACVTEITAVQKLRKRQNRSRGGVSKSSPSN